MNPSNMGVGGNTSLPPPVQLASRNAPVSPVLIPLGNIISHRETMMETSCPHPPRQLLETALATRKKVKSL